MAAIEYLAGDATVPRAKGPKIVAHVCNDRGRWGKGFVLALSAKWQEPEKEFRRWFRQRSGNDFGLGAVQIVAVREGMWVANMVGQHGTKTGSAGVPIRYEAVDRCLARLAEQALALKASVHMPRIGCGLAGGKWERIEPLVVACGCVSAI
jgi:O-acetyl-ADP-ribose deacetylase (regulator of RNase III)